MSEIVIHNPGPPIAKKRPRISRIGKHARTFNSQQTEEGLFLYHVQEALGDKQIPPGPLMVTMVFLFKRPKSHYGTGRNAEKIKPSAPPFHTQRPDVDNLVKFGLDVLNNVWDDDCKVVELKAWKEWYGGPGRTIIKIQPMMADDEDFLS